MVSVYVGDTARAIDEENVEHNIRLQADDALEIDQAFNAKARDHLREFVLRKRIAVHGDGQELAGEIVVAAGATFAGAVIVAALVVGHATISESARLTGTVLGLATFTGSGCLDGGTATSTEPDPPPTC